MSPTRRGMPRGSLLATLLSVMTLSTSTAGPGAEWQPRVSAALLEIYQAQSKAATGLPGPRQKASRGSAHFDSSGRVEIDVHFDCALSAPTKALAAAGLRVSTAVKVVPYCVVEGWAAPAALPEIASIAGVTRVALPVYARHHSAPNKRPTSRLPASPAAAPKSTPQVVPQNSIDGAGITIMRADLYAQQTGANGAGVTVAIMSDDVTSIAVIQGRGELPANITIYASGGMASNPTDEGTVMLEEV